MAFLRTLIRVFFCFHHAIQFKLQGVQKELFFGDGKFQAFAVALEKKLF